jgi:hypothetical protein
LRALKDVRCRSDFSAGSSGPGPTKYKLAITMKTAKALRITVPPSQLARRDEVIE